MKTPMELVQDACLEVSAKGYHEPYEEMKLAALSLATQVLAYRAAADITQYDDDADGYAEQQVRGFALEAADTAEKANRLDIRDAFKKISLFILSRPFVKQVCLVCGQPSGHWRHWPNVPGEHYVVPVHAEQSDFHSFQERYSEARMTAFANANLIAAAPELLDLLERAVKVFNWVELPSPNTEETWDKFVAACEAAIHKAEGV